ncbi:uncharacterized protein LOC135399733 [Ornithodoros turicata]|uniref:uncharacterized protein LOC135399733 n=1 Tax=Ornithodoros turicata TaxID=34597 RepID=UPI00313948F9
MATRFGSEHAIHADPDQQRIFFSRSSLYAVIGMLTVAVLFCAAVLAYTLRRNDLVKKEYFNILSAISHKVTIAQERATPTTVDTTTVSFGPAATKKESTVLPVVVLALTRKPLTNISSLRGKTVSARSSTTKAVMQAQRSGVTTEDPLYYDDLDVMPKSGTSRRVEHLNYSGSISFANTGSTGVTGALTGTVHARGPTSPDNNLLRETVTQRRKSSADVVSTSSIRRHK